MPCLTFSVGGAIFFYLTQSSFTLFNMIKDDLFVNNCVENTNQWVFYSFD